MIDEVELIVKCIFMDYIDELYIIVKGLLEYEIFFGEEV